MRGEDRAPRKRKRISCELMLNGARYSGIILDLSATGMFVQTTVKPGAGDGVTVKLKPPGRDRAISLETRVARKKLVPPQLLMAAQGGIGLAIVRPVPDYLDFIASLSPEHAEAAARERARGPRSGRPARAAADAPKRFRVHAVETSSGRKNSYLMTAATEQAATDQVLSQLGGAWQVLFVERA